MKSYRDAVLFGVRGATDAHSTFGLRERVEKGGTGIDVFGIIDELRIPLFFKPLDKLLGTCIRVPDAGPGILITTERDLHLQRFTAAHELGHYILQHEGSFDNEVGPPKLKQPAGFDWKEVEANAFAAEFLLPKWLFRYHVQRHNWSLKQLSDPGTVYQLSLRMGVSYESTCWGLQSHNILGADVVQRLRAVPPKMSKLAATGNKALHDPWADVWILDDSDTGGSIDAGPSDVFILRISENAGSGFLWDVKALADTGFELVDDQRAEKDPGSIGGPVERRLVFRLPPDGTHKFRIAERRPWQRPELAARTFTMRISTFGKASPGQFRRRDVTAGLPS